MNLLGQCSLSQVLFCLNSSLYWFLGFRLPILSLFRSEVVFIFGVIIILSTFLPYAQISNWIRSTKLYKSYSNSANVASIQESTSLYKAILLFHRIFSYIRHILLWQFRSNDSRDNLVILITLLLYGLELKENFRTLYMSIADIE